MRRRRGSPRGRPRRESRRRPPSWLGRSSSLCLAIATAAHAGGAGAGGTLLALRRALRDVRLVVTSARLGRRVEREVTAIEGALHLHRTLGNEAAGDHLIDAVHVGIGARAEDQIDDAL